MGKKIAIVLGMTAWFIAMLLSAMLSIGGEPEAWRDGDPLSTHPVVKAMYAEAIRAREQSGIKEHPVLDEETCKLAQTQSNTMARTQSMEHSGDAFRKGEIIAMGQGTPEHAIQTWNHSGSHWPFLCGEFKKCGFGFQRSAGGTPFWTGCFMEGSARSGGGGGAGTVSYYRRFRRR